MLHEHLGLWQFLIFFWYCIKQETVFPQLLKRWENHILKCFMWAQEAKHHSQQVQLNIQQMSNIQTRLVIKPEIIRSRSACKDSVIFEHTYLIIIYIIHMS